MSPVSHFLASWLLAAGAGRDRRERAAIACAGIVPDVDGLGLVPELLTRNSAHPLLWFSQYHHSLHTLAFALVVALAGWAWTGRRWRVACLVFLSFHLHLLGDLLGARGPDGYPWPIPYLAPFSQAAQWSWSGQWALNAWPNLVITLALLLGAFLVAWKSGKSPLEFVSENAHQALVDAL